MTQTTEVAAPPPPDPAQPGAGRTTGDKIRFVLRGVGQTLITLGLVVLLFVVYEVWITNIYAAREQKKVTKALIKEWNKENRLALPGSADPTVPLGSGLGILYIPRLGRDYHFTIVQGSAVPDDAQLEKGPAHYKDTQLPGQVGNFAVAGHRVGKGEPFLNLDKLRSGDAVIVETRTYWYVYKVLGDPAGQNPEKVHADVPIAGGSTVSLPGRVIIDPSQGQVLDPVPTAPGQGTDNSADKAAVPLMTMTTCHPKFTASHRMIVFARLAGRAKNVNLTMPQSVLSLYDEVKA
jgi:sortase A